MSYSHNDSMGIPLENKLDKLFNKNDGFFIELGANNGLFQSNTAFLEKKRNWKGILIEPSIYGCKSCVVNRPNSTVVNMACVSDDYKDDYVEGDFNECHPMGSVNGERLGNKDLVKVRAITLKKILDELKIIQNIDFLSLDTEGYELNILKGLDLEKYRPNYMLIEIYNKDYGEIIEFLNENDYELHSNFSNYNKINDPHWDGTHNDYLFIDKNMNRNIKK